MTPSLRFPLLPVAPSTFLLVGAAACGAGDRDGRASAQDAGAGPIQVDDVTIDWPANPHVAAVRMVVRNESATDDRLLAVTSPVAEVTSIHRTGTDALGRAMMEGLDGVAIPARSKVTFDPGGLHLMVTGLTVDLQVGDEVPLNLTFERAGEVKALAEVVEPGSVGDDAGGSHDH